MEFELINQWDIGGSDIQVIIDTLPFPLNVVLQDFNCCLAGGYIRSFYDGTLGSNPFAIDRDISMSEQLKHKFNTLMESGTDIDIFTDSLDTAKSIINFLSSKLCQWEHKNGKKSCGVTDNSTYADFRIDNKLVRVQAVYRLGYTDTLSSIRDFDFTCTQAGIWFDESQRFKMCRNVTFVRDCKNKIVRYTEPEREEEKAGSFRRSLKYIRKGWTVGEDTMAKLICRSLSGRFNSDALSEIYNELNSQYENVNKFPYFK